MMRFPIAFGLAFDVLRTEHTKSGFMPAQTDLGAHKMLFAELRLEGFAAAIRTGFALELVIVGGDEGRYKGETPIINRAEKIREMLIHDYSIDERCVRAFASRSNTGGNIQIIRNLTRNMMGNAALLSSHYHLPRAHMDLIEARLLNIEPIAAEALWLLEDESRKDRLIELLGGNPLAQRVAEEIQGIAHKIKKVYAARTDTTAST